MRLIGFAAVMILCATPAVRAQQIPLTVIGAENDGARFTREAFTAAQSPFDKRPFGGTTDRRCVAPPPSEDSLLDGSLRSGEVILRTHFYGPWGGFRAGKAEKALWLPLHTPDHRAAPLLIRAARLGHPADTLRQTIARPIHSHGEFGYPSSVQFPTPGEWVAVVTTATDWGCFLLSVAP